MSTASASPIALVTGGSRGLGRNTVEALAARGVRSVFTYHSNEAAATEVVEATRAAGAEAAALRLDVSDASSFAAFAARLRGVLSDLGATQLHYLVNNAGTGHHASFAETTEDALDTMYRIHVKGPFLLTQALLPQMADGGRIVNLSSGLARFALPGYAAYASMKGAIEVLTRYQAKELAERGITVNTVAPGAIETDFGGGAVRDNEQVNQFVAGMTALGRVGLPDDIGPMIASLLDDANGWVTGQRIEVSGGMLL
ncbi:MAG: SDR family oxidoreductase [Bacteroidota bacterium]